MSEKQGGGGAELQSTSRDDECKKCGGNGVVPTWRGSLHDDSLEVADKTCPECGGSGLKKARNQ